MRDKDKVAIFSGNVVVTQGDTIMKCKTLHVFYDQDEAKPGAAKNTMKAAQPGPAASRASGGSRRAAASGDPEGADRDRRTRHFRHEVQHRHAARRQDGVVINQGTNVLRGERLVVDLTTALSRVEWEGPRQGIFSTNKETGKDDKPATRAGAGRRSPRRKSRAVGSLGCAIPAPLPAERQFGQLTLWPRRFCCNRDSVRLCRKGSALIGYPGRSA